MDRFMSEPESLTLRFTRRMSPFEWRVECDAVPNVRGIGSTMQAALQSWAEALPITLLGQHAQIFDLTQRLEQERRR